MKAVKEIVTIYNKPNAAKVGYPIVNNCVASGFSAIDYFVMPSAFTFSNSFEMVWKVNTGNFNGRSVLIGNYGNSYQNVFQIDIRASLNFGLLASSNGSTTSFLDVTGTYTVLTNTDYWIRAGWTGTVYYLDYSLDGINYTRDITVNSTTKIYQSPNPFLIGYNAYASSSTEVWAGSVDFSESYIKTDDNIWWQGVTEATESVFKTVKENVRKYYKYGSTINGIITGTLTNNNGVLSGFSTSNYVTLPNALDVSNGKTWEFSTKVVVGSQQSQQSTVLGHGTIGCGGIWIEWNRQSNKKFGVAIGSGTSSSSSWDIASHVQGTTVFNTGTTVWLRCVFDGSSYKLFSKLNKEDNWIQELSVSSSASMSTYTKFIGMAQSGGSTNGFAWVGGSIDMKETYINVDGAQWWRGVAAEESTSSDYDYYKDVDVYKAIK